MKRILLFFLMIISYSAFAQPTNDDCDDAINIPYVSNYCSGVDAFTNVDATEQVIDGAPTPIDCVPPWNSGDRDVWFTFTTPADTLDLVISINGSTLSNPQIAIYRGDCTGFAISSCLQAPDGTGIISLEALALDPNELYYIRVNDYSPTATPNSGTFQLCIEEYVADVNMQDGSTTSCSGTIYDSGGPTGGYSNDEDFTYIICPSAPNQCIFFTIDYDLEGNNFDELFIYDGADATGTLIGALGGGTGQGTGQVYEAASGCMTLNFTSDGSVTSPGWTATWQCSATACTPPPPPSNCVDATDIGDGTALPYDVDGFTTCGVGNDYSNADACGSTYMNGEDYVFTYTSPGNECIHVNVGNTQGLTGVFVLNGCPDDPATVCIDSDEAAGGNPDIPFAALTDPGVYYIVVATNPGGGPLPVCTSFDLLVETADCPVVVDCNTPEVIPSLPYDMNGLSTCGAGNNYSNADACGSFYMNGEDYVFEYTATEAQCINVTLENTATWTGVFVLDGCPSDPTANCLEDATEIGGNPSIPAVSLPAAGTYYIVVSTNPTPDCTPFDIMVTDIVCPVYSDCNNPDIIPSLPYDVDGLTTCGAGNNYDSGDACGSFYMNGEDYVFEYTATEAQCINVTLENTATWTGVFVLDGCPSDPATDCLDDATSTGGNPVIPAVNLPAAGTYYIVVSTNPTPDCTPFDIIVTDVECPVVSDCSNPDIIPSLPYDVDGLTTCGAGNNYDSGDACGSFYMNGEDYVFSYTSPGNECINIILENTATWTGVFILDGCPNDPDANCIDDATSTGANPSMMGTYLENPGEYFIVVSTNPAPDCTPFDIFVESTSCPIIYPPSENCSDALVITACEGNDQDAFLTFGTIGGSNPVIGGTNAGCIIGPQENFIWFYMEAQADGEFAFTLSGGTPSDIDYNVYGPYATYDEACTEIIDNGNAPIRSSWAGGADPTGCENIHPVTGAAVTDLLDCDGNNDDFTDAIDVLQGEVYIILVDDYGGAAINDGLNISFGNTTDGVLDQADNYVMEVIDLAILTGGTAMISADTSICLGETVSFQGTGALTYSWTENGETPTTLSCFNCADPVSSPNGSTSYQVIAYGLCSSDTFDINVNVLTLSTEGDTTVCYGEFAPLSAITNGVGGTLVWTPTDSLSCTDCATPMANPTDTLTTYYVTYTSADGSCSLMDSVTVRVLPEIITETTYHAVCLGEPATIGGLAQTESVTYTWTPNVGLDDSTLANPTVASVDSMMTYYVVIDNGLCTAMDSSIVSPRSMSVTPDQTICNGDQVPLTATSASPVADYDWSPATGLSCTNCQSPTASPTVTTTYTVTDNDPDCPQTNMVTITVINYPTPITAEDALICDGDVITIGGAGETGVTYSWVDGNTGAVVSTESNPSVIPNQTTTYTVTATAGGLCEANNTVTISVGSNFTLETTADTTIFQGNSFDIITTTTASSTNPLGQVTYIWTPSTGLGNANAANTNAQPLEDITYSLTATSDAGCSESTSFDVTVIEPNFAIPTAFSPNGDGHNEHFDVIRTGNIEVDGFKIFNRWGQLMYDNANTSQGWDGTYEGKNAPQDTYIYYVILTKPDGEVVTLKGDFVLLR